MARITGCLQDPVVVRISSCDVLGNRHPGHNLRLTESCSFFTAYPPQPHAPMQRHTHTLSFTQITVYQSCMCLRSIMWLQSHLAARLSQLICPSSSSLFLSLSHTHLLSSWLKLNCKTSGSSLIINFHSRVSASVLV